MAFFTDLANVNTTTTGTGTITLGAALSGYQTFAASGVASGDWVRYRISDTGNAWEIGWGQYSSTGPTLTRTLNSSSTGSLLSLSGAATVFVNAAAADLLMPYAPLFGTGSDGSLSAGFGSVNLSRDTCYANIVFGASDQIITNGFILAALSCDLSAASANAIIAQQTSTLLGNAGSGSSGGATNYAVTPTTAGTGGTGTNGGNGGTTTGTNGPAASGYSNTSSVGLGGVGGYNSTTSTSGGAGSSGAGGRSNGSSGYTTSFTPLPMFGRVQTGVNLNATLYMVSSGSGGAGGGGGGGDGTNSGGGGGGGGACPPRLLCAFRILNTGSNSTAGLIANVGGKGGAGGNATAGNTGGGGGGSGSGGGPIYLIIGARIGSTVSNGLNTSAGNGGNGGNGFGTGLGGTGGPAGAGGGYEVINISARSYASNTNAYASGGPAAATTTAGTSGATAAVIEFNL